MTNQKITELRNDVKTTYGGLSHLESLLYAIKMLARTAGELNDPNVALRHMETLSDMGAEQAGIHSDRVSDLNDIIDDLDQPVIDMMKSGLQANSIQQSLAALLQVIPEDQTDTIGSLKTVLKLAHDLSMHLASGGKYKFALKEALDDAAEDNDE